MLKGVGELTQKSLSPTIPFILFAIFQLKFAIITPALITGSFAERVSFKSYVLFVLLFEVFVYSPIAHMTWHPDGLLHKMGVLDFAGGTVVHISAGIAALVGAYFLGSRFPAGKKDSSHAPANIPFVLLGTGLLWFGWFGFNSGSSFGANGLSAMAFATTHFASASAMIAWIILDQINGKKPSAMGACIGAVVGLVAITPGAGFVSLGASVFIGMMGAFASYLAVHWRAKTTLDDTLDVFPCHGVGGIVGMLLTGVFAKESGLVAGKTHVFFAHLMSLIPVTVGIALVSYILYWVVDQITALRVSSEDEKIGLDISQHDEVALSLSEIITQEKHQSIINSDIAGMSVH
jgi:Amt family ammonium transporter